MVHTLIDEISCCYINDTDKYQIVRISNIPHSFFERTVFPGRFVTFKTCSEALLEVHTGSLSSAILSDVIPCNRLCY